MKRIYSIVVLLSLLFAGTSCEEDYRNIIFFEGVEPIYQVGTCNNFISSATLYLTQPDGLVLGIDGGDGSYSLKEESGAVATAEFTKDVNGYRRIKLLPKSEGTVNIVVKDSRGNTAILKVVVKECYKFYFYVSGTTYLHSGKIGEDLWESIQRDLDLQFPMKEKGYYTLIPALANDPYSDEGELNVNLPGLSGTPLIGTYKMMNTENGNRLRFAYNGETHDFYFHNPFIQLNTRTSPISPVMVYEDVTSYFPGALPEGCEIYKAEQWMYMIDVPDVIFTSK